nr:hypothetical protein Iba_chr13dCG2200 [Ipomoea batatas]GMD80761.1 hypothetical protein Iba_chr13eCG5020 [Ipomoea batatas]
MMGCFRILSNRVRRRPALLVPGRICRLRRRRFRFRPPLFLLQFRFQSNNTNPSLKTLLLKARAIRNNPPQSPMSEALRKEGKESAT